MKKTLSLALVVIAVLSISLTAFAATDSATVFVTVADKGNLVAPQVAVTVTDIDNDGALTVNDALYAVHKEAYPGGADGYGYYTHETYGLSLSKLWGDSSGNFGYYLNNTSCWSLADTVKEGDYVTAFVYSDSTYYSDVYTFFDKNNLETESGSEITLTLSYAGYDANWNSVTLPLAGAEITVGGEKTGVLTDENGKATIKLEGSGDKVISAESSSKTIVPPVCVATVEGGSLLETVIDRIISFISSIIDFIMSVFAK